MTTKKAPIPGWRTMTAAQRRNAQYDRIWKAAKDAQTRFNESSRDEKGSLWTVERIEARDEPSTLIPATIL